MKSKSDWPGVRGEAPADPGTGKIVHIQVPAEHVEPQVRELDPALLMLDTRVPSAAEGEKLLEQIKGYAR